MKNIYNLIDNLEIDLIKNLDFSNLNQDFKNKTLLYAVKKYKFVSNFSKSNKVDIDRRLATKKLYQIITFLLNSKQFDINSYDEKGYTILMIAAMGKKSVYNFNKYKMVKLILSQDNLDLNKKTKDGKHILELKMNSKIKKLLISNGLDLNDMILKKEIKIINKMGPFYNNGSRKDIIDALYELQDPWKAFRKDFINTNDQIIEKYYIYNDVLSGNDTSAIDLEFTLTADDLINGSLKTERDALLGSISKGTLKIEGDSAEITNIKLYGGSGNGAKATVHTTKIDVSVGISGEWVEGITITTAGSGYKVGDVLKIEGNDIGRKTKDQKYIYKKGQPNSLYVLKLLKLSNFLDTFVPDMNNIVSDKEYLNLSKSELIALLNKPIHFDYKRVHNNSNHVNKQYYKKGLLKKGIVYETFLHYLSTSKKIHLPEYQDFLNKVFSSDIDYYPNVHNYVGKTFLSTFLTNYCFGPSFHQNTFIYDYAENPDKVLSEINQLNKWFSPNKLKKLLNAKNRDKRTVLKNFIDTFKKIPGFNCDLKIRNLFINILKTLKVDKSVIKQVETLKYKAKYKKNILELYAETPVKPYYQRFKKPITLPIRRFRNLKGDGYRFSAKDRYRRDIVPTKQIDYGKSFLTKPGERYQVLYNDGIVGIIDNQDGIISTKKFEDLEKDSNTFIEESDFEEFLTILNRNADLQGSNLFKKIRKIIKLGKDKVNHSLTQDEIIKIKENYSVKNFFSTSSKVDIDTKVVNRYFFYKVLQLFISVNQDNTKINMNKDFIEMTKIFENNMLDGLYEEIFDDELILILKSKEGINFFDEQGRIYQFFNELFEQTDTGSFQQPLIHDTIKKIYNSIELSTEKSNKSSFINNNKENTYSFGFLHNNEDNIEKYDTLTNYFDDKHWDYIYALYIHLYIKPKNQIRIKKEFLKNNLKYISNIKFNNNIYFKNRFIKRLKKVANRDHLRMIDSPFCNNELTEFTKCKLNKYFFYEINNNYRSNFKYFNEYLSGKANDKFYIEDLKQVNELLRYTKIFNQYNKNSPDKLSKIIDKLINSEINNVREKFAILYRTEAPLNGPGGRYAFGIEKNDGDFIPFRLASDYEFYLRVIHNVLNYFSIIYAGETNDYNHVNFPLTLFKKFRNNFKIKEVPLTLVIRKMINYKKNKYYFYNKVESGKKTKRFFNSYKVKTYTSKEIGDAILLIKFYFAFHHLDINRPGHLGQTPLIIATFIKDKKLRHEIVDLILSHPNIDINKTDHSNTTPLWYVNNINYDSELSKNMTDMGGISKTNKV